MLTSFPMTKQFPSTSCLLVRRYSPLGSDFFAFLPALPLDLSLATSLHILTKENSNKGNAQQEEQQ